MDYLENITSCDKVENCVVLSEFEANLSKAEDGGDGGAASTGEVCSECHGEVVRPQVGTILDIGRFVPYKIVVLCFNLILRFAMRVESI